MNGTAVNNGYPRRNADAAAFRQIKWYYKYKLPYARNLANLFSGKSLKLLPQDVKKGRRLGRPSEFAPPKKILATPLFTYLLNQCFTGNTLSRVVFTKFITISNSEHDKGNSASDEQRFGSSRPVNCSILCRAVRTTLCRNESYNSMKYRSSLLL